MPLGSYRIASEQLDVTRKQATLEKAVPKAELLDDCLRANHERAGLVESTPHRFEHRLAANRDSLDHRRGRRDPKQTNDVETTTAGTSDRTRPPQRGNRRRCENGSDAAAIIDRPCRSQRRVKCFLALADATGPGEDQGTHEPRLGNT